MSILRLLLGLALVLTCADGARAESATPAAALGLINGTVRIQRLLPHHPAFEVTKDPHACGKEIADDTYVLGPNRELANVVIELTGVPTTQTAGTPGSVVVDQIHCRFVPRVTAFPAGTTLIIKNSDATLHNTHTYMQVDGQDGQTVFNLALPLKGMSVKKSIDKPGILKYTCDAGHTWMRAWSYVTEHPYVAVTNAVGHFELRNVPAGTYTLKAWHEAAGTLSQSVTIGPGPTTQVEVVF